MNTFDQKINEIGCYPLKAEKINILIVLLTFKCNLRCAHCYLDASPDRTEEMSLSTINKVLNVLKRNDQIKMIELTGGETELNPHFKYFVKAAYDMGKKVTIASNILIHSTAGMEDIPGFLAEHKVKIFASLPYYREEEVDAQRGKGVYGKVISGLKKLNELGYGHEGTSLELDLEFNPHRIDFAPDREILEKIYREKLMEMHGITFNSLVALNNAPLGRTRKALSEDEFNGYMKALEARFNPDTVKNGNLMCKYSVCISPEGGLYDCAFFRKLDRPLKNGNAHIDSFDYRVLSGREITTGDICSYCAAGSGVSCFKFDKWS